jgi:hypothetical protein
VIHWNLAVRGPFGSCKSPLGILLEEIEEQKEVQAFLGISAIGFKFYYIYPDSLGTQVDHDMVFLHLFTGEPDLHFLVRLPVQGKLHTYRRVGSGVTRNQHGAVRLTLDSMPEKMIFLD